jgi:hypothetical protein
MVNPSQAPDPGPLTNVKLFPGTGKTAEKFFNQAREEV